MDEMAINPAFEDPDGFKAMLRDIGNEVMLRVGRNS